MSSLPLTILLFLYGGVSVFNLSRLFFGVVGYLFFLLFGLQPGAPSSPTAFACMMLNTSFLFLFGYPKLVILLFPFSKFTKFLLALYLAWSTLVWFLNWFFAEVVSGPWLLIFSFIILGHIPLQSFSHLFCEVVPLHNNILSTPLILCLFPSFACSFARIFCVIPLSFFLFVFLC